MPSTSINVTCEDFDGGELDDGALTACVQALADVVPWFDKVSIVLAVDFKAAARRRIKSADEAESYEAFRTAVGAVAKVFPSEEGTAEVLVWASAVEWFSKGELDAPRLFAHEGYHVRLKQLGGATSSLGDVGRTPGERFFLGSAGVLLEEFRVERALNDRGWWPPDYYRTGTPAVLARIRTSLGTAVAAWQPPEPIEECMNSCGGSFRELSTYLAYLAAEFVASEGGRLPDGMASADWERLVGDSWPRICELLAPIPGAGADVDDAEETGSILGACAADLAGELREWFRSLGFAVQDLPGGAVYFQVLRRDF